MDDSSLAIGIFDSGVGGLTVMQQMIFKVPDEDIVYFGDTARLPYGEKSGDTIVRYSIENTMFLIDQRIKMLVVACNTASAYALEKLNQIFNIPIVGVVKPGARKAVEVSRHHRIAVLGTRATIHSGIYQKEIKLLLPSATVFPIACPLLAPLVEERFLDHQATKLVIKEYLAPLKEHRVDTILLGCTHYPLLYPLIQQEMSEAVIVDSASTCAEEVASVLKNLQLERKSSEPTNYRYFVSDDPDKFRRFGEVFLGKQIQTVEQTDATKPG